VLSHATAEQTYPLHVLFFMLLHIPLAWALWLSPALSSLHALMTVGVGLVWLIHDREPYRLIYLTAYITGAELLWRGTHAFIFWEFGKYAVGVLFVLALLKQRRFAKADKRFLIFFLLLLPSFLVLPSFDRQGIAFNLSGPFALAVAAMFFSTVTLTPMHLKRIFVAVLAPILGLCAMAAFLTLSAESISFTGSSIKATAAGIGPNQVASILGLGAFLAILHARVDRKHKLLGIIMTALMVGLVSQAALTFSRGGVWAGLGAIAVAILYSLRDRGSRTAFAGVGTLVFLLCYFWVFPALDGFTEGGLSSRFRNFEGTGRERIIQADLMAFRKNPLLGVGPGRSRTYHWARFRSSSPHTEYTRLLAEHGSLGLIALLILVWISATRLMRTADPICKACHCSFTAWALLFMLHSAMRLVAPCLLFGLASANILSNQQDIREETGTGQILPKGQAGLPTSAFAGSFREAQGRRDVGRRASSEFARTWTGWEEA
jgi:hypothetical protein